MRILIMGDPMSVYAAERDPHKGGRPPTADPKLLAALKLYLPYANDPDLQRREYARQQILDVIYQPDGMADAVYRAELHRYTPHTDPKKVPSREAFEDLMYRHIYHQYRDSIPAKLFSPAVMDGILNPDTRRWMSMGPRGLGVRSPDSIRSQYVRAVLVNLMLHLVSQAQQDVGLADPDGRFAVPGYQSGRTPREVSIDQPVGESEDGPAMAEFLPAPAKEQPEVYFETPAGGISSDFPEAIRPYIGEIMGHMAPRVEADSTPAAILEDVHLVVDWYALERIGIASALDDEPEDVAYWQDPVMRHKLSEAIANSIIATRNK